MFFSVGFSPNAQRIGAVPIERSTASGNNACEVDKQPLHKISDLAEANHFLEI